MSDPVVPLSQLSAAFRQRAALVESVAPYAAVAFRECAEWLEASLQADLDRALTLEQAVQESGWSYEGLRRALEARPDLNRGRSGAPLIRRSDLPQLGAPRGPRGKYGPRTPKSVSLTSSTNGEGHQTSDQTLDKTAPTDVASADTDESADVANGQNFHISNDRHAEPARDSSPEPEQVSARPTKPRKARQKDAPGQKKRAAWRRSHDARFDQLLARAARP